jgi:hypothetical protein
MKANRHRKRRARLAKNIEIDRENRRFRALLNGMAPGNHPVTHSFIHNTVSLFDASAAAVPSPAMRV